MTETLTGVFPLPLQDPESPDITALSRAEVASLRADIAKQASVFGLEKALEDLQYSYAENGCLDTELAPNWGRLKEQTVVDLGAGTSSKFREFLVRLKISGYIGVELYPGRRPELAVETPMGPAYLVGGPESLVPQVLVEGDMLDVVSRLPDESCSFAINGIDDYLVDSQGEYGAELVQQIDRATAIGGHVMGLTRYYGILSEFERSRAYASIFPSHAGMRLEDHLKVS